MRRVLLFLFLATSYITAEYFIWNAYNENGNHWQHSDDWKEPCIGNATKMECVIEFICYTNVGMTKSWFEEYNKVDCIQLTYPVEIDRYIDHSTNPPSLSRYPNPYQLLEDLIMFVVVSFSIFLPFLPCILCSMKNLEHDYEVLDNQQEELKTFEPGVVV
jgi:hypothetical protein